MAPKYYQDSLANPNQFGQGQQGQANANAWSNTPQAWTPGVPWWEPWLGIAGVAGGGALAGAFSGAGAGAAAAPAGFGPASTGSILGATPSVGLGAAPGAAAGAGAGAGVGLPVSQAARGVGQLSMGAGNFSGMGSGAVNSAAAAGASKGMDPFTIMTIASLAGQGLQAYGASRDANQNRQMSENQFAKQLQEQQRQFNLQFGQQQANTGLAASQMNPFAQQRARGAQALLGSLMANYQPARLEGAHFTGGIQLPKEVFDNLTPFLSPAAMGASERAFQNTARAASPTYNIPDYQFTGYGTNNPALRGAPVGGPPPPPPPTMAQPRGNTRQPLPGIAQGIAQSQGAINDEIRRRRGGV